MGEAGWVERFRQYLQVRHSGEVRVIETHISWVLLADTVAYKVKKPVDFGFIDFSTLQRRKRFCEAEVALNRRLAPQIYLDSVPIYGSEQEPTLSCPEAQQGGVITSPQPFEFAVRMMRFDPDDLLAQRLERGGHGSENRGNLESIAEELAVLVAAFHSGAEPADSHATFGSAAAVWAPIEGNFKQIAPLLENAGDRTELAQLQDYMRQAHVRLSPAIARRKQQGFIRACHGDLHSGNIALIDERPVPFDCIEFNDNLRYIDVASDLAFLLMDLHHHRRQDLANRVLNTYLAHSGDYALLPLLPYYQVYRAMVRAKVSLLRLQQVDRGDHDQVRSIYRDYRQHIRLALSFTADARPFLALMHGVSGSGKSTVARRLCAAGGALHLRSDVQRKRLYGLAPEQSSASVPGGIYTREATERTFGRLQDLTRDALQAGWSVVVDATFLHAVARRPFMQLAQQCSVPFAMVSCRVDPNRLEQRLRLRSERGDDASEAGVEVMRAQLQQQEPFTEAERVAVIVVDQRFSNAGPDKGASPSLPGALSAFLAKVAGEGAGEQGA